jgi:hypothetical protein
MNPDCNKLLLQFSLLQSPKIGLQGVLPLCYTEVIEITGRQRRHEHASPANDPAWLWTLATATVTPKRKGSTKLPIKPTGDNVKRRTSSSMPR